MALVRLAVVALASVVAAAAAPPVAAQADKPMAGSASVADTMTALLQSLGPATVMASEPSFMPPRKEMGDRPSNGSGPGPALSVEAEFFTVPAPFPEVDLDVLDMGGGLGGALSRGLEAIVTPYAMALEAGRYDSLFKAARRGLFDQTWYSVNVMLEMASYVRDTVSTALSFLSETLNTLNSMYIDFREGAFDDLSPIETMERVVEALRIGLRLAPFNGDGPLGSLAEPVSRMRVAQAHLKTQAGGGPWAHLRKVKAGGHVAMRERIRSRTAKTFKRRFEADL